MLDAFMDSMETRALADSVGRKMGVAPHWIRNSHVRHGRVAGGGTSS